MFFELLLIVLALAAAALIASKLPFLGKIIPYNVVGGFVLLTLAQIYSFEALDFYVGLFLAAVFAHAPLGHREGSSARSLFRGNRILFNYSLLQYLTQWSLGILAILLIIKTGRQDLHPGFGAVMPGGFSGGYGSAAVLGELFTELGFKESRDLLMFSATVGIISAVVGGAIFTKAAGRSFTSFSFHARSYKSKSFLYIGMILAVSLLLQHWLALLLFFEVPLFCFALAISFILRRPLQKRLAFQELGRSSAVSTDLLVTTGIGSIQFLVIHEFILILTVLFALGIFASVLLFKLLGQKVFKEDAYEKALFTWGWAMGGIPVALGLVQSLDKEKGESIMSSFAFIYLLIAPFEMALLFTAPWLLLNGHALSMLLVFIPFSLALIWRLKTQVSEKT